MKTESPSQGSGVKLQRSSDKPSYNENSETRLPAWKKKIPAVLPARGPDQLKNLERTLFSLVSCVQDVQHASGAQNCEMSPMLEWTVVAHLSLRHFCSCKLRLIHIPAYVSSKKKSHSFSKLDFVWYP